MFPMRRLLLLLALFRLSQARSLRATPRLRRVSRARAVADAPETAQESRERREFARLLRLSLPTLGCTLMDPALRLMDTACVGQTAGGGALAQAALVPCTNVLTFAFAALFAVGQSLTNFFATHPFDPLRAPTMTSPPNLDARNRDLCIGALLSAFLFTAVVGTLSTVLMLSQTAPLLQFVGASAEILPLAMTYLRICAPALPFAMLTAVLQGAFLGQQNAMLPLKIILLVAGPINFFGDIELTLRRDMGIAGVAIATAVAQVSACSGFVYSLTQQPWWRARKTVYRRRPAWRSAVRLDVLTPLLKVAGVLIFRSIAAIASYSCMSYFATRLPTKELAAHQVAFQLWWFFSFAVEPFSTAIQSIVAKEFNTNRSDCQRFVKAATKLAIQVSLVLATLQALLLQPSLNFVLARDAEVRSILSGSLFVMSALSHIPSALAVVLDGCVIATGGAAYMPRIFALAVSACVMTLTLTAKAGLGLNGIWLGLHAFMFVRLIAHGVWSKTVWELLLGKQETEAK